MVSVRARLGLPVDEDERACPDGWGREGIVFVEQIELADRLFVDRGQRESLITPCKTGTFANSKPVSQRVSQKT